MTLKKTHKIHLDFELKKNNLKIGHIHDSKSYEKRKKFDNKVNLIEVKVIVYTIKKQKQKTCEKMMEKINGPHDNENHKNLEIRLGI